MVLLQRFMSVYTLPKEHVFVEMELLSLMTWVRRYSG